MADLTARNVRTIVPSLCHDDAFTTAGFPRAAFGSGKCTVCADGDGVHHAQPAFGKGNGLWFRNCHP